MRATEPLLAFGRFPVTAGLLALLVAIFLVQELQGGSTDTLTLLRMGANYPPLIFDGQIWRLVTAAVLHIGFVHMLVNGWALWQLGRLSEITFGSPTTLALFVYTGITGSLLTLLTMKISAGASGAIFGLEGALVAFFLRHRDRLTPAGKSLLQQLLVWSALMTVYGFVVPGIDWLGHLGGFAGGMAVGWALQPWRGGRPGALAVGSAALAAVVLVASIAAAAANDRMVLRTDPALGVAVEAPGSWRVDEAGEGLVLRDPLAGMGSAAFVSVGVEGSGDREAALVRALEGDGLPEGLTLGAAPVEVEGGWLRRTFVWQLPQGELAGFAQARCEGERCLVVLAAARGTLYGRYFPTLARAAASARFVPPAP